MERPERIVLLIIGGLANRMEAVLWVLAVLGNWTVFNRIYYTWKELPKPQKADSPKGEPQPLEPYHPQAQVGAAINASTRARVSH